MTRPDDAMEKVLAGLREVKAPAGMERRILERLEGSAEARGGADWRPLWFVGIGRPGLVWSCGVVAAAIVIALAIPAMHRRGRIASGPGEVGPKVAARPEAAAARVGSSPVKRRVLTGTPVVPSQRRAGLDVVEAVVQIDEDSVAMSEMQAASFPAPPMPLTEQEKLLLRMMHKGAPVELAMLDPKKEALQDAEEKAEFQRFFAKAAVKEPEEEMAPAVDEAVPQGEQALPAEEPKREESTMKQMTPEVKTAGSQ